VVRNVVTEPPGKGHPLALDGVPGSAALSQPKVAALVVVDRQLGGGVLNASRSAPALAGGASVPRSSHSASVQPTIRDGARVRRRAARGRRSASCRRAPPTAGRGARPRPRRSRPTPVSSRAGSRSRGHRAPDWLAGCRGGRPSPRCTCRPCPAPWPNPSGSASSWSAFCRGAGPETTDGSLGGTGCPSPGGSVTTRRSAENNSAARRLPGEGRPVPLLPVRISTEHVRWGRKIRSCPPSLIGKASDL
jgi:hypothetical protein